MWSGGGRVSVVGVSGMGGLRVSVNILITVPLFMLGIGRSRGAFPAHAPLTGPNSFIFAYILSEKCLHWRSMPP